jgi:hypothetical protein
MKIVEDILQEIGQQSFLHNIMFHTIESIREEVFPRHLVRTIVTEAPK